MFDDPTILDKIDASEDDGAHIDQGKANAGG
jgi:hypothetical protein